MKSGSLFTGIAGFDLGFENAGIKTVWQAEIDKNCLQLLEDKFPKAKRYTDVRDIGTGTEAVDVITGGFPCQDVSVAGRRAGLAGERSGLWFEFHRIIAEHLPGWVVIENVPGLLSSNEGKDFAVILRGLVECGYGVSWRVLDAQYFGVAQRRRRVFIVGSLGNGRSAKVLFESEGVPGNTPPRRETGQRVADSLTVGANQYSGFPGEPVEVHTDDVAPTLASSGSTTSSNQMSGQLRAGLVAYNIQSNDGGSHKRKDRPNGGMYVNETDTALTVGSSDMTAVFTRQRSDEYKTGDIVDTISQRDYKGASDLVANTWTIRGGKEGGGKGYLAAKDKAMTLGGQPQWTGVRRLTPTECERLQGFPDGWTEGFSDSARYRMLGNAVAVPVAEWIAKRIVRQA